jgi:hypothetical protein
LNKLISQDFPPPSWNFFADDNILSLFLLEIIGIVNQNIG